MQHARPRPHGNCFWVVRDHFLAGEYPRHRSLALSHQRLERMLDAGIDCFVDLTHAYELKPYEPMLREIAATRGLAVRHLRHPIQDEGIPESPEQMTRILDTIDEAISKGHRVYVHCYGGIGRTGTVVGCYLVRHGMSGDDALRELAKLWRDMEKAWRRPHTPETAEQALYVIDWREPHRESIAHVVSPPGPDERVEQIPRDCLGSRKGR